MTDAARVVVVAGASGLVGQSLTKLLLADARVARVVLLVRKQIELKDAKIEQRVVSDFKKLDDVIPKDIDDAYCCLGTTMKKAGSKQAFLAVDFDAVVAFAKACRAQGARRFLVVSSMGADPRSMTFYLRTKGEMERAVMNLGFDACHSVRPFFLDGPRGEERAGEKLGLSVMKLASNVLGKESRYAPIHVDTVAKAMIQLGFSEKRGAHVHESDELHALAKA
jgi:uncharacterized protein YbjT (DUF2867 family)